MRFTRLLARRGICREQGEGIVSFSRRAQAALPEQQDRIQRISELYSTVKYSPVTGTTQHQADKNDRLAALEQELKREVARFRP